MSIMVDITVKKNGSLIERAQNKPVRIMPDGLAGVVYKGKVYPLYEGNEIDLADGTFSKEQCESYFKTVGSIRYKQRLGDGASAATVEASKVSTVMHPEPIPRVAVPKKKDDGPDKSQLAVIQAGQAARILVDAGPGTGKTEAACRRVAWLVQNGVVPSGILLISFTRAAVHEIRNRITALASKEIANSIHVSTIDSLTWKVRKGHASNPVMSGDFEDNIRQLAEDIDEQSSVQEFLQSVKHLLVDEAQDVVGDRAQLIIKIIENLSSSCGVTILADDAQAIYGFASGDNRIAGGPAEASLSRLLTNKEGFHSIKLDQIHRTDDPNLLHIFSNVRDKVLEPRQDASARYNTVKSEIERCSTRSPSAVIKDIIAAQSQYATSFVLFRTRTEVLEASANLSESDIVHRVRMSGLPAVLPGWIAGALGTVAGQKVGRATFLELWKKNVSETPLGLGIEPEEAFERLRRIAPDKSREMIEIPKLRDRLSRYPPSIAKAEIGEAGPILSTIHASKGREADGVTLILPALSEGHKISEEALDEETRVIFVAATRARRKLTVSQGEQVWNNQIKSGRACSFYGKSGKFRFEIGRAGDLDAESLAGRSYFSSEADVLKAQAMLIDMAGDPKKISCFKKPYPEAARNAEDKGFRYRLCLEHGGQDFAVFQRDVTSDIFEVGLEAKRRFKKMRKIPNVRSLNNIHFLGLTTIAISTDDPLNHVIHEPWSKSGLILAPIVFGFSWAGGYQ